jgi:putative ABC transport system permease protein
MMYLKLALRNLFRKKARLFVTLAAVGFGCCALIATDGFIEDGLLQIQEQSIEGSLGHYQIAKKGRWTHGEARPSEFVIEHPEEVIAAIRKLPHVRLVSPRLWLPGLLSNGDATLPVRAAGIVPSIESSIGTTVKIVDGKDLADSDADKVILGKGLAEKFGASVGQPLILLSNSRFGAISGMDVSTKGIYWTGSRYVDDWDVRMPLASAQKLLQMAGATDLVVFLDSTDWTNESLKQASAILAAKWPELEARPWYVIETYHQQTRNFVGRQFRLLQAIIVVIVILSVHNTLEMMVLDRVGEIGTTMSLGFSKRQIVRMFMTEGVLLGLIGACLGVLLCFAVKWVVGKIGIEIPPPPGLTKKWYGNVMLTPAIIGYPFVLSFFTTVLSAMYPAFKAASTEVADALRQNV